MEGARERYVTVNGLRIFVQEIGSGEPLLLLMGLGAAGDKFDPQLHNAVMHVEDDEHGEDEIVDVFQKGYRKGDKIIRHAMVKVAN